MFSELNKIALRARALALPLLLLGSCTIAPRVTVTTTDTGKESAALADGKLFTTIWQQRAAEYRALCFQAYNIAQLRVDALDQKDFDKPMAIMTDVDETALDNSRYQAHQTLLGKDYDAESWYQWTAMGTADTVPGALHFFKYAAQKGIEVFYVTNREEKERAGTLANLKRYGFPFADNEHLMLKQEVSSKEPRRQSILENHSLVMFVGDNLNDLSQVFEKKLPADRMNSVDSLKQFFGNRFIVLPNPVYGDWESSLYKFDRSLTAAQKDSVLRASLYSY